MFPNGANSASVRFNFPLPLYILGRCYLIDITKITNFAFQDILINTFFQVNRPLTMKKEGIQTRNRKISTKLKKAQKDQRLDSNFRFLDRSLAWGGAYGMAPGPFHPGFPSMAQQHGLPGLPPTSYASPMSMTLPPPPMAHHGGIPSQSSASASATAAAAAYSGQFSPFWQASSALSPSSPSSMAFG